MTQLVLSSTESTRLDQCEAAIEKGLRTFVEVGNALLEIRDSQLYRQTHDTFANYCRDRWQLERAHAYRLIGAAQIAEILSPRGDIQPTSERQVRPLASLEPAQQREAWAAATAENPKPTAAQVEKAAKLVNDRVRPRVSQEELDRLEEIQRDKDARQRATVLFYQCVLLFDPVAMGVEGLTDHLLKTVDLKMLPEQLLKERLQQCSNVFSAVAEKWKETNNV